MFKKIKIIYVLFMANLFLFSCNQMVDHFSDTLKKNDERTQMHLVSLKGDVFNRQNDVWYSSDGINWTENVLPVPWGVRGSHTSVVFNNKLWVLGGEPGDGSKPLFHDVWSMEAE